MPRGSLIAGVGATHARCAFGRPKGVIECTRSLACKDYPSLDDAIEAYLREARTVAALRGHHPTEAALAIAGPVTGDRVSLTNHPWSFSTGQLRRRLGVDRLLVINDFTAVAAAIPYLQSNDYCAVGDGNAAAEAPIAVLGPGSGLGVSGLIPMGKRWFALSG